MELMDTFAKYDIQIESSCKKNETLYFQIAKELNSPNPELKIEPKGRGDKTQTV